MTSKSHGADGVYSSKYYAKNQQQQQQQQPTYQADVLANQNSSTNNNNGNDNQQQQIPFEKLQLMSQLKFDHSVVGPLQSCKCWICGIYGTGDQNSLTMFKPCACGPAVHRTCWWNWHRTTLSTKTWWSCPTCLRDYRYETMPGFDASNAEEEEVTKEFHVQLALFYVVAFLILSLTIAFFVLVGYFGDADHFDVPIGMTYLLTSVVEGVPTSNTTELWRTEFASGNATIWPYYLLLSVICTSVLIIIVFLSSVIHEKCCDDDDWEDDDFKYDSHGTRVKRYHKRPQDQPCSQQCHCHHHAGFFYCWACTSNTGSGNGCGHACDKLCNPTCFDVCCSPCSCNCPQSGGGGACGACVDKVGSVCSGCGDKCGGCIGKVSSAGDSAKPVMAFLVIIVIIAVIVSAVAIIVYVASTRFARLHAEISEALYCRSAEMHGKMLVLGEGETIRTSDEV